MESALMEALGLTVSILNKGESGEMRISYKSLEQLDGLCRLLRADK
jgi:ParB family chromosome partitioning protein